jgi:ABC-2 type transport system permease protein
LHRLALVELRKMTDTRAGFWLLLSMLLIALAGVTLMLAFAPADELRFSELCRAVLDFAGLILPVLGILAVTSEWSQRTTLTTFTLVPRRERVIGAKLLAVLVLALAVTAIGVQIAVVANLLAPIVNDADGAWDLSVAELLTATLLQALGLLGGFAVGLALLRSAPAIVLAYMLPITFAILAETIPGFRETADWLDTTAPTEALWNDVGDGTGWAQLASSWALWLGVPLAIGLARVRRIELA